MYTPPFEEFEVERIRVPEAEQYQAEPSRGPSILLVFKGKGVLKQTGGGQLSDTEIKVGDIFFIPHGTNISLEASSGDGELELYGANVNGKVF